MLLQEVVSATQCWNLGALSDIGLKTEKLKAKQWGFSSKKSELFVDEPGPPVRRRSNLGIRIPPTPHRYLPPMYSSYTSRNSSSVTTCKLGGSTTANSARFRRMRATEIAKRTVQRSP